MHIICSIRQLSYTSRSMISRILILFILGFPLLLLSQNDYRPYSNFLYDDDASGRLEKSDLSIHDIESASEIRICEIEYLSRIDGRHLEENIATKVSKILISHNNFFEHAIDSTTNFKVITHIAHQGPFDLSSVWVNVSSSEVRHKYFDFIFSFNFAGNILTSVQELTGYINGTEYYHSTSLFEGLEFKKTLTQSYLVFDGEYITEPIIFQLSLSEEGDIVNR